MAFDRSVIQDPTGMTTAAVAMAALALSAAAALAGREPALAAPRAELAARAAAARAALAMKYAQAMLTRALAKAEPCLGEQYQLWEQAGLAFDEIAAQRDVGDATWKRAARAAVECWKHLDDGCWFSGPQVRDDRPSREELSYGPRKLVAAIEAYGRLAAADTEDDRVSMALLKADTYRQSNHFEEALSLYRDVLDHHHVRAEIAAYAADAARECERRLDPR